MPSEPSKITFAGIKPISFTSPWTMGCSTSHLSRSSFDRSSQALRQKVREWLPVSLIYCIISDSFDIFFLDTANWWILILIKLLQKLEPPGINLYFGFSTCRKSEATYPLPEDSVTIKPMALVSNQQKKLERKVLKAIPGRRHLRSGRNLEMVKRGMVAGCLRKIQAPDPVLTKFDSVTQPQKRYGPLSPC